MVAPWAYGEAYSPVGSPYITDNMALHSSFYENATEACAGALARFLLAESLYDPFSAVLYLLQDLCFAKACILPFGLSASKAAS